MFWLTLAFAQEAPTFPPIPVDHELPSGEVLPGILVDEATFAELGTLRVSSRSQKEQLASFEEWRTTQSAVFTQALGDLAAEHAKGQEALVDHYEARLAKQSRADALHRLGFPAGIVVGVAATVALTVATLQVYDAALPSALTRH